MTRPGIGARGLPLAAVVLAALASSQCGGSSNNAGPNPSMDAGSDVSAPIDPAPDAGSIDVADAPKGAITEEEWKRISGPVDGPHEIEPLQSLVCPRSSIAPEYQIQPTVSCVWNTSHDRATDPTRDCNVEPYCRTHADCAALGFGRCRGSASASCFYPGVEGALCTDKAQCTELPNGSCPALIEMNTTYCYPTGRCEKKERRCFYREEPCLADADCTSAPGGACRKVIRFARCESQSCLVESDCPSDQVCECSGTRNLCIPADCKTDADCSGDQQCRLERRCNNVPGGYHCTTPTDTCQTQADCRGSYCGFDGAHWSCATLPCPIIE